MVHVQLAGAGMTPAYRPVPERWEAVPEDDGDFFDDEEPEDRTWYDDDLDDDSFGVFDDEEYDDVFDGDYEDDPDGGDYEDEEP